jgi:hypothetical protein
MKKYINNISEKDLVNSMHGKANPFLINAVRKRLQTMKDNINSIKDNEPMNHKMFWNRMGMKDDEYKTSSSS